MTELLRPSKLHLSEYVDALKRGWSPDNVRGRQAIDEELRRISDDPDLYLSLQDDEEAKGAPIELPDGQTVPRLPGIRRWIWDGEFCGIVGFRWQKDTSDLPSHVLGHIGFSVVPWKQRNGHATLALRLMLHEARDRGLAHIDLTTDPDNIASQKVIEANGGNLLRSFKKSEAYGGHEALLYRIFI